MVEVLDPGGRPRFLTPLGLGASTSFAAFTARFGVEGLVAFAAGLEGVVFAGLPRGLLGVALAIVGLTVLVPLGGRPLPHLTGASAFLGGMFR